MRASLIRLVIAANIFLSVAAASAQTGKAGGPAEWDKLVEAAKKEGQVVVSSPPSAELRKGMEEAFTKRFGIVLEAVPGRGAATIRRMVDEAKAGIRYFDLHFGGTESTVRGLLPEDVLAPVEPSFVLPEVKDPKNWWGGHIWIDNAKRWIYSFAAYQTQTLNYNSDLAKPEEIRSFDDYLNPKWHGKIGFSDPRIPGSGASIWSFLLQVKGEEYLKKLVAQKMFIGRDLRLLAESLVKGRVSHTLGIGYTEFLPFLKAGLPIKTLPTPKEGTYATAGYGSLVILKNGPHPNATKVFVNWLLGKEGQEIFTKTMGEATRRLDIDTKWMKEFGVLAAKDGLTLDQYYKMENQSEDRIYKVREPGAEMAKKLLDGM
ncbi:MAG TPA: extracellular solute-binding protein [Candidatus Binatia bacterium]|jgi:iron(III) transport system substrate-binding protein